MGEQVCQTNLTDFAMLCIFVARRENVDQL